MEWLLPSPGAVVGVVGGATSRPPGYGLVVLVVLPDSLDPGLEVPEELEVAPSLVVFGVPAALLDPPPHAEMQLAKATTTNRTPIRRDI
jgi:hypothetical protein